MAKEASDGMGGGSQSSSSSEEILEPEPIAIDAVQSDSEMDRVRAFNSDFKRGLIERNQKDSLQLLKVRQQQEAERKKLEEERAQSGGADDVENAEGL